jgi:hypothetical protein
MWSYPMGEYYDFDGEPITHLQWTELFSGDRMVAFTEVDDWSVSTIWLGLDHSFGLGGSPLIFETMIFGGPCDGEQWRYPNRHAALAGHDQAVAQARAVACTVKLEGE